MDMSWREFEQLVARIETQLAPKGATVRSPDKIQDKVTGQMREVDASIRYQIGSAPILITIECRERSAVQDDTWIEQLIMKRQKLGAQQTIAVSSSGFSGPAIESAQQYGLELRKIEEITDSTISSWLTNITIEQITTYDAIINYTLDVDADAENVVFSEEIEIASREKLFDSPVLFRAEDNVGISINDMLHNFFRWQAEGRSGQESYVGLSGEHDEVKRRIEIALSPDAFYTFTTFGKVGVLKVVIDLYSAIERKPLPLTQVYQYSDMEKSITQIAVASMTLGEKPVEIGRIFVQPSQAQEPIDGSSPETAD